MFVFRVSAYLQIVSSPVSLQTSYFSLISHSTLWMLAPTLTSCQCTLNKCNDNDNRKLIVSKYGRESWCLYRKMLPIAHILYRNPVDATWWLSITGKCETQAWSEWLGSATFGFVLPIVEAFTIPTFQNTNVLPQYEAKSTSHTDSRSSQQIKRQDDCQLSRIEQKNYLAHWDLIDSHPLPSVGVSGSLKQCSEKIAAWVDT